VLLTDRLGQRLGVQQGDTIIVEVLEGERAQRPLVVAGLVYELIGLSAYMEIQALRRLLREGDTISLVSMLVEPSQATGIYTRLKQVPKVATVSIKAMTQRSFTQTTAATILVFTGILTAFATIIAVGIVYNNARIALAERTWELASLRVLGFSRRQVSAILLTELGLEVLLAMPLGWWLGYLFVEAIVRTSQTEMFRFPAIITPRSYAVATLVILLAALGSALIVRRRIDHLDLIGALKTRD
jgi:putative ABC transport system permease protein